MRKLLNIDGNPKTVKGQARGYLTAILYLSPYTLSGANVCPTAELAGCWQTCLNIAGHGGIPNGKWLAENVPDNAVQRARLARTAFFHEQRAEFMRALCHELDCFLRLARKRDLTPCVRLNGTSDLLWERMPILGTQSNARPFNTMANPMSAYPELQFYDYTKLPARLGHPDHARKLPANYHLSISWSGADPVYQHKAEVWAKNTGAPLVVVCSRDITADSPELLAIAERAGCTSIVNGDEHDLRFTDPPHALVVLKAKGLARRESNGFILRSNAS